MTMQNLDRIFAPRSVAVIGASARPGSVGRSVLENLQSAGFPGPIYPVNPKHASLLGLDCYPQVSQLPQVPDVAIIATPASTTPGLVAECGDLGIRGLIMLTAGFRETGTAGRRFEEELAATVRRYDGMRVVGPNCLGVQSPRARLNAGFAAHMPTAGSVAFVSQSGALCTAVLDWARTEQIGFSLFISLGNMLDVGFADVIDYLADDAETQSIVLYVESIHEAREFMSAARCFSRNKPIVVYKSGRFAESAKAAASHTGAMLGEDDVYDAAFRRAGAERILEIGEMFDCAELLARGKRPAGPRLAIVTNAGGPGVMATDSLIARRGQLAQLQPQTIEQLNQVLPPFWSHGNPIDVLGDAPPERFGLATTAVLNDAQVDAALVILTPQAMTDPHAAAVAVAAAAAQSEKPVLASWMGGPDVATGIAELNRAGIPTYFSPERGVSAFMHMVSYARNQESLYVTPQALPAAWQRDQRQIAALRRQVLESNESLLSERVAKEWLSAYGVPVTQTLSAETAEAAIAAAEKVGYPVVLKIESPDISHKTDVGGVELNLTDAARVRKAFDEIVARARAARPTAQITGVTVQPFRRLATGRELILGVKRDATFGPVVMIGMGGIAAELLRDRALELPPLNERLVRRMLESLQAWPLLSGYRGRTAVHLESLIETIMCLSYLVAHHPEIQELDVNPLLATPEGCVALDARILIDRAALADTTTRDFCHLAIRPYPEEFVRAAQLPDGRPVTLRPIRPEDEALWYDLLARCTVESVYSRFRYAFKSPTHKMASRYCYIDYDREMAIVAEVLHDGQPQLIGVGRLVADPDRQNAEYAVLVVDAYQGKGLGNLLTDYCLEVAQRWGVQKVTAETAGANHRMAAILRSRGFQIHRDASDGGLRGEKLCIARP